MEAYCLYAPIGGGSAFHMSQRSSFRNLLYRAGLLSDEEKQLRRYFDAIWYLDVNSDVREGGLDPFWHFLEFGINEGRDPNPAFSSRFYQMSNPDVQETNLPAIVHYIRVGWQEGKNPHPLFDIDYYLSRYEDLRNEKVEPLLHYLNHGRNEGRQPHPLFDPDHYWEHSSQKPQNKADILAHYQRWGHLPGHAPHLLFDHDSYLSRYPDVKAAEINALIHYLEYGGKEGRRPHEYFDTRWYLTQRPDVAQAGINPLVHYVRYGAAENANPSSQFDALAYLEQLSPQERDSVCNALAHYLKFGKSRKLKTRPAIGANVDPNLREYVVRTCSNERPTILMVLHNHGGGTEFHVYDLARHVRQKANALILQPSNDGDSIVRLTEPLSRRFLQFDINTQWPQLIGLLAGCNVRRVHVHHVFGMEGNIHRLVGDLNVPFDLTLHDHWMLGSGTSHEMSSGTDQTERRSLGEWLLAHAQRTIVPSEDAMRRLQSAFPQAKPVVIAHLDPFTAQHPRTRDLLPGMPLRIGILGTLTEHKGLDVVMRCASIARQAGLPLRFVLLGAVPSGGVALSEAGVEIAGAYQRQDVLKLIERRDIHLLWYPVQVPETYSYTLSEGLASGLPLVVPDSGAFPERVGGRRWVWVEPATKNPEQWAEFFSRLRSTNLLVRKAPAVQSLSAGPRPFLTYDAYLAWAQ